MTQEVPQNPAGCAPEDWVSPSERFKPVIPSIKLRFVARGDREVPVVPRPQPVKYALEESVQVFDLLTYNKIREEVIRKIIEKDPKAAMFFGPGEPKSVFPPAPLTEAVVRQAPGMDLETRGQTGALRPGTMVVDPVVAEKLSCLKKQRDVLFDLFCKMNAEIVELEKLRPLA